MFLDFWKEKSFDKNDFDNIFLARYQFIFNLQYLRQILNLKKIKTNFKFLFKQIIRIKIVIKILEHKHILNLTNIY
jgi:hypothetical protein